MSLLLAGVIGCAAVGCGSSADQTAGGTGSGGDKVEIDLHFSLDVDGPGGKPAIEKRVSCTQREVTNDCGLGIPMPPKPTPPNRACTEIYGGPEVLRVTGVYDGKKVDAKLTRANGCEIKRFDFYAKLLERLFPGYKPGGAIAG